MSKNAHGKRRKGSFISIRFTSLPKLFQKASAVFFILLATAMPTMAQGIVLKPEATFPILSAEVGNAPLFLINGNQTFWQPAAGDNQTAPELLDAGGLNKLVLALMTLRLVDKDYINLETNIATLLPHIVRPDGFQAQIKIHHLLQETAGFASPPLTIAPVALTETMSHNELKRFAIRQRSPGQLSSHDPVGWAIMMAAIEGSDAMPFKDLLMREIAVPLGLNETDLTLTYSSLGGPQMPLGLKLSRKAIATISGLLNRNRSADGTPYLQPETYQALMEGQKGFRFHPDGDVVSFGIVLKKAGRHLWIEPLNNRCGGLAFAAYPREGVVLGAAAKAYTCTQSAFMRGVQAVASNNFPGRVSPPTNGPRLAKPTQLEGRYTLAERSPYGLSERLDILEGDFLNVFGYTGDQVRVRRNDVEVQFYRQVSAYRFENEADPSDTILFSPFRLGGYVKVGEHTFRRADILGTAGALRNMLPWAIIVILTAGYYANPRKLRQWRRMGQFALLGGMLVGGGLYLDANYWAYVLYEMGQPWMITLWRLGINLGLMLVLSLPMFVLSFAKKEMIPTKGIAILTAPHLVAVALSSLMVFFALVLWGMAGTVSPY